MALPSHMRVVRLEAYHEDVTEAIRSLHVVEQPVPKPGRGQVLVKIEATPCNPSDLLFLQGKYGQLKKLPAVPGWEGAGTVVASGHGWLAGWLNNRRVACGAAGDRDGTWAEYFLANAKECIPLKRRLAFDAAASLIINPLTAIGLLDTARRGGHRAAVHTAGASQLGRMLIRIAGQAAYPLICVVRRQEQVHLLKSLGAELVLNSADVDFDGQLAQACQQLHATVAFEAIAGDMTGRLLGVMPQGSCVYVYGSLSEKPCGNIDPIDLIFRNKTVTGFFLGEWIRRRGVFGVLRAANRVQRMLIDGQIETQVQRHVGLDEVADGLLRYVESMSDGKVLILPHKRQTLT
ncbi:MAG: zinc-binding dehydrogenase [Pirellulaceae bacterium]